MHLGDVEERVATGASDDLVLGRVLDRDGSPQPGKALTPVLDPATISP